MKRLMAILTPLLLLAAAATSTHADIVWDGISSEYLLGGPPRTFYTMNQNGGEFMDLSVGWYKYDTGISAPVNHNYTQQNVSITQATFPNNATVYMESRAYGSITPNGLNNIAATILEHENVAGNYGIVVKQEPKIDMRRNFYVTSDMTATLSSAISGSRNFFEQNFDWSSFDAINPLFPFYGYTIIAYAEVQTFSKTMGLISEFPVRIDLNNDNSSGTETMSLVADPDIYYTLHSHLFFRAKVKSNDAYYENPVPLGDKVFEIGNWDATGPTDPVILTSTVTPLMETPVPGSVLLLFSGLAGLFTARRRSPGKPGVN